MHCSARLNAKAFNRLLGQRSDNLVNIAAISAGGFQSQIRRVRQDNPKGPPVSNPWFERRHHECLCHGIATPFPGPAPSSLRIGAAISAHKSRAGKLEKLP
jgi:hypothetical protein